MKRELQAEALLSAWVKISSIVKNSRLTKELPYNEAVVMLLAYNRYQEGGDGLLSLREIKEETKMLKSLVNRTVSTLEEKHLLERAEKKGDKRVAYVRCVAENLDVFLAVHQSSLDIALRIIDLVGAQDAQAFIRLAQKIYDVKFSV